MGWCSWTTLPAAVQPPFEPGGERLAAGEGVSDAPAALRGRRGAEEGGGRGHGEAQGTDGAGGVAKSMRGYLAGLHFVAFAVLLTQRLVELLGKVINGL